MPDARSQFAAVTLLDGRVLVVGGYNQLLNDPPGTHAAIYDPSAGTWTPKAPTYAGHRQHTATLLGNGRVLIFGGWDPSGAGTVQTEIYDPVNNQSGSIGSDVPRLLCTATALSNGKVLACGGADAQGNALSSCRLYDPASGISTTGSMLTARYGHQAVQLGDSRVLITGGSNSNGEPLSSAELYDPATGTFSAAGAMSAPRIQPALAMLPDWKVLVAGGLDGLGVLSSAEVFDPASGTWSPTGSLSTARVRAVALATGQGGIAVLGGYGPAGSTNAVELYDPAAGTFHSAPSLQAARDSFTAVSLWGKGILVAGGYDSATSTYLSSAEVYAPDCVGAGCLVQATVDQTLHVPRCQTVGAICDSAGTLNGRGALGPEPAAPGNLSGASCADGTAGTYHVNESLDGLRVSVFDGQSLKAGAWARVDATVWAGTNPSADHLDLYYADDANNPDWQYLDTLTPTQSGQNLLSSTFTLSPSALQVVRGHFRVGGTADSVCSAGAYDESDDLVFAVDNGPDFTPPAAAVTSPAPNATLTGNTTLSASATDDVGVVAVELYDGATLLQSCSGSPCNVVWNVHAAGDGPHALSAKAYDAAGNVGTSAAVPVTVAYDATAPTVAITSPGVGATASAGTFVYFSASDNVGVASVALYVDGAPANPSVSGQTSPLVWYSQNVPNGPHTLSLHALDANGNEGVSPGVQIVTNNDFTPPTVAVANPSANATIGGTVLLSANASDNVGVVRVDFVVGSTLLCSWTSGSPADACSWYTGNLANGTYALSAIAYDAAGNTTTSDPVTFTIYNDQTPPTVAMTAPSNNATVSGTVTLSATATDNVAVARVLFKVENTLVCTVTSAPYSCSWNSQTVLNGSHYLYANAYDTTGNVAANRVAVTVSNPLPTVSFTSPANGAQLSGTVTLSATASSPAGVSRVDFYDGTTRLGSVSAAPYNFSYNAAAASAGSHTLYAYAYDPAGNRGTAQVSVTVVSSARMAAYDATYRAPRCVGSGSSCDSGTLLNGRANLGPEPNASNTLFGSCADGTSGTYHSDESLDALKVSTLDGSNLAPGKQVKVEAKVWAYAGYSSDHLDLYYAADANNPSWVLITTLTPTAAGSNTLSATFTLPSGTLQAVRGSFRYGGTAAPCPAGSYNDRDDLVFSTQ